MTGFIKLHRKMLDWEWYSDVNTKAVFLHLLLNASYKPSRFEGYEINAGDCVCGLTGLSERLGISKQKIRTALKHLKSTGEITYKSTSKFSVVTLVNYSKYQYTEDDVNIQINNQSTGIWQADNNIKEINNKRNKKNPLSLSAENTKKYGIVEISVDRYNELIRDYGASKVFKYTQKVNDYCRLHNKTYADYGLAIEKWIIEDLD